MAKKYQREIEDILKQAGETAQVRRSLRSPATLPSLVWRYTVGAVRNRSARFSPGRFMFIGVALLLAILILPSPVSWLVAPLAVAGLILFFVGYGMFFIKPRQRYEKRWRGQPIDDDNDGSLWDRFRRNRS
jgi:VIT1/CCC1 family predicted Fe2+/Mn2+ transporter